MLFVIHVYYESNIDNNVGTNYEKDVVYFLEYFSIVLREILDIMIKRLKRKK